MSVTLVIPGNPQGKGRARAFKTPAGHIGHYTPARTRTYEGMIRTQAIEAMGSVKPFEGPVLLTLRAVYPVPKSWPKWKKGLVEAGQILPTVKPDIDNVEKAVKDALNGVVWKDDCQVCAVVKHKLYPESDEAPHVRIAISQIEAAPAQCDRGVCER